MGEKRHFGAALLLLTPSAKRSEDTKDAIKQNKSLKQQIGPSQLSPCHFHSKKSLFFIVIYRAGVFFYGISRLRGPYAGKISQERRWRSRKTQAGCDNARPYLQFPCHGHHLVISGVVLIAIGEHQSYVRRKFLSISVFPVLQFRLERRRGKKTKQKNSPLLTVQTQQTD